MKIYVVWLDGEREFSSDKYFEARSRFNFLVEVYGDSRVEFKQEII